MPYIKKRSNGNSVQFTVNINKTIYERLQEYAYQEKQTMALTVEKILDEKLPTYESKSDESEKDKKRRQIC